MNTHIADVLDVASQNQIQANESAINMARKRKPLPRDFDGESCTSCGGEIEPKRLAAMMYFVSRENINPHDTDEPVDGGVMRHGTHVCFECANHSEKKEFRKR